MSVTEQGRSIWKTSLLRSSTLLTAHAYDSKWMPSKRPTQNVKNDGSVSLLALACHLDRTTGSKTRKSVKVPTPLSTEVRRSPVSLRTPSHSIPIGREASTSRKVAIKKIKVGQFKDGLDMSAIREVKYLRELHHQNIIEVIILSISLCIFLHTTPNPPPAHGCILLKNKPQSRSRVLG